MAIEPAVASLFLRTKELPKEPTFSVDLLTPYPSQFSQLAQILEDRALVHRGPEASTSDRTIALTLMEVAKALREVDD